MADEALGAAEQAAWGGLLRTHERLWRAMEAGLSDIGLSLAEYDVLLALDAAGPDGARMGDLSQRRLMSTGGFTRLADRLEQRRLLDRRRSDQDGRSLRAHLTTQGRSLLRRARKQHHRDVRALFVDHLDADDLERLTDIWRRLDVPADAGDVDC